MKPLSEYLKPLAPLELRQEMGAAKVRAMFERMKQAQEAGNNVAR